jgi:hypothetical protein
MLGSSSIDCLRFGMVKLLRYCFYQEIAMFLGEISFFRMPVGRILRKFRVWVCVVSRISPCGLCGWTLIVLHLFASKERNLWTGKLCACVGRNTSMLESRRMIVTCVHGQFAGKVMHLISFPISLRSCISCTITCRVCVSRWHRGQKSLIGTYHHWWSAVCARVGETGGEERGGGTGGGGNF